MTIRVGISGWTYRPWRGDFYPPGLRQRDELRFVAERMNSVEINGSFYSLQRRSAYASWAAAVPEDFEFAVKGGRFITHMKKLNEIETPLANFFASGVLALDRKLGPLLWQLPPNLGFDRRADGDVPQRPAAYRRRGRGDRRRAGPPGARRPGAADRRPPGPPAAPCGRGAARELPHARSSTTCCGGSEVGLVLADNPGQWPIIEEQTSDLMYVRLHGHEELYASGYSDQELDEWAAQDPRLEPGGPGCLRLLRQRRQGARPVRRHGPDATARTEGGDEG